jgi:predicted  nucleic acid-binding Zn-ribbon protein
VPPHSQLLEVQEIDLECDRLGLRRRSLNERDVLEQARKKASDLDEAHAQLLLRRETLNKAEHALSGEVAGVAAKAKEVEDTLYSGTVTISKELAALQAEVAMLRARQSGFEEQEMELLEEIDSVENEIRDNRTARDASDGDSSDLQAAIRKIEGEIDAGLARLSAERGGKTGGVPPAILAAYDHLRTRDRMAGRGAAALSDGRCAGCQVKLPVLEYNTMKAEPEDALLTCVRCRRVLVR